MHLIVKEKDVTRLNKFIEWLIYMFGYTLVFIIVDKLFSSMHVDTKHFYLFSMLIVLIIYILNKTIKPVIIWLTLPLTALTLGLFYLIINLKI